MAIFMKVTRANGKDIRGNVTAPNYLGWIDLLSVQLGGRRGDSPGGHGVNREAAMPAVSAIVVTKHVDKASTELRQKFLWGAGAEVQIDFVKTVESPAPNSKDLLEVSLHAYLSFTLQNALVASYINSGSVDADRLAIESLTLNFATMSYEPKAAGRLIPGKKMTA